MRVCYVITKPELGGAQLSTLNLLLLLPKDKYNISIITSPRGILASEFNESGVRCFFSPFLARGINPLLDILAFIHILLICISIKPVIVHTHSSKAGIIGRWAARFAGVPIIVHTVHGWSFNKYQGLIRKRLFIFLEKITAGFTSKIICVSRSDMNIGQRYKIASNNKFVFIKYGIQISNFRKPITSILQKKKELGIFNNDPVVGMISCLKPQKSPLDYIKASIEIYNNMPKVNFLLIGDGILRRQCERLIADSTLNGRFKFTGWRRDIADILDVLDIVVLTSLWEGMPVSIIEALCKGRPVVATNVGGTAELVKDGVNGFLITPGSYRELVDKILKILEDRALFYSMKKEAFVSIDDSFLVDRMVGDIESLYSKIS